jgi:hypothetical protein
MTSENNKAISSTLMSILDFVDRDRLMEHTRTIAQWQRLSGTPEEREAFDYIEQTIAGLGYEVERLDPVCLTSLPGAASITANGEDVSPCITHSFSASTPPNGIEAELVYAGRGFADDYEGLDVAGKIVLVEGLATPHKVQPAEAAGAAAVIHNSGEQIHEMIISPVWGSPTSDTVHLLPTIPHLSIGESNAERLKNMLEAGSVTVRVTTEVDTGWRPLPVLVASLETQEDTDQFVMLSGHVDSWYHGAMDNGSANASMLECARLLAENQDDLRRSVVIAFWSGHSHARYGTSAWYADEYWHDLHHNCVAHINIDSPGGVGATFLSAAHLMAETYPLAHSLIAEIAGQELEFTRMSRMGDQSFWGVGLPSMFTSISQQPAAEKPSGIRQMMGGRGGGLGWWWHTADDTLDKIDPDFLVRDCRILLASVYRFASDELLPIDQRVAAKEISDAIGSLADYSVPDIDMSDLEDSARDLQASCEDLASIVSAYDGDEHAAELINNCLMGVSRILIPVTYTTSGQFEQDLALPTPALPGLQPLRRLAEIEPGSHEYHLLVQKLRRERNRVEHAILEATQLIDNTKGIVLVQ